MAKLAQGLDLNITGFRIGPRDPNNPSVAAVGQDNFFYQKPPEVAILPKVLKGRDVLGGGYKFPKESLKARAELAGKLNDNLLNDSEHLDDTILLQDQIINDLNLIPGAHPGADNKSGSLTKAALTKDLTENITKEIEKLRRQGDNIITRKQLFVEGKIDEETPEERNYNIKSGLEDKGCTVIYTEDERVQAMRHQTGQLGGLGAITMEEVVAMRELTAQRIKELEIEYYKSRDTRFLSV